MKTLKTINILLFLTAFVNVYSQISGVNAYSPLDDAMRLSQNLYLGTGRAAGMGSAFGALGADFSSIAINPAGLGVYRSSEFLFTPAFDFNSQNATYLGTQGSDTKLKFNFNNVGYEHTHKTGNTEGLVSLSFAIGYNQLNDFYQNYLIQGYNPNNSIVNSFVDNANSNNWSNYREQLAWNTHAINYDSIHNTYNTPIQSGGNQTKTGQTTGQKGEWDFALGANISNKLYIGASLGIETFNYGNNSSFIENNINLMPNAAAVDSLDITRVVFQENYKLTGSGINFKVGLIYRVTDFLRVGAAIHTPTAYNLTEDYYNTEMQTYLGNGTYYASPATDQYGNQLNDRIINYRFRTPTHLLGSVGLTFFKCLAVDLDYEYVNYSTMSYKSEPGDPNTDFTMQNQMIQSLMRSSQNLRIGGELKLSSLYLRAGGGYFSSPYKSTNDNIFSVVNKSDPMYSLSCGLGYREGNWYMDLAYTTFISTENVYPYTDQVSNTVQNLSPEPAKIVTNTNRVIATFGFKF